MEKVPGIGERDPKALARWYREHLGVTPVAGNYYDERGWEQQARPTGFAPFPETASISAMPGSNAWSIFAPVIWTRRALVPTS